MSYPIQIKDKAKHLRTKGYSIREIAKLLAIAQGTASVWSENVKLDTAAKLRLQKRRVFGQYKSGEIQKQKSLSNKNVLRMTQRFCCNNFPTIRPCINFSLLFSYGQREVNQREVIYPLSIQTL